MDPRQEPVFGVHIPQLGVIWYTGRERNAREILVAIDKICT
jgi:hypothetical protein